MIVLYALAGFILIIFLFMQKASFGQIATGELKKKIIDSSNFNNKKFNNRSFTPDLKEGVSYYTVMKDFFFKKEPENIPSVAIPSTKTNFFTIDLKENCLVWFGHSSYFMQVDGKRILVDPVFSGAASPISFTTKSFAGSDRYSVEDIPAIDYLFISHDHWDHLDYETVKKLEPKVNKVFCGLGVKAHLLRWGYDKNKIIEADWDETIIADEGFTIHTVSARHFSGRGFKRNQSLWMSFILQSPSLNIFIGGDSGYDAHFKTAGEKFGPFDWAILECGQYHEYWKYIHMMPEEVVRAAKDLGAKHLLPVHWAKFSLALHSWSDPINRVIKEAALQNQPIAHPMIGEKINLNSLDSFTRWWEQV